MPVVIWLIAYIDSYSEGVEGAGKKESSPRGPVAPGGTSGVD